MLRAGGKADRFLVCRTADELSAAAADAFAEDDPVTILGFGSNVLISDRGIRGLTILNRTKEISDLGGGVWEADCGVWLQDLMLRTIQNGWTGLEYAVGIPGSLGGALVSNAGAYRSSIAQRLEEVEVVTAEEGRRWEPAEWMQFAYRDSRLRANPGARVLLLRARLRLKSGNPAELYKRARGYQEQRIHKQPPGASAGSFFKNVYDHELAEGLSILEAQLKTNGVVPAGVLIESLGLRGFRMGCCSIGRRHANFIVNDQGASAADIRSLAEYVKSKVEAKYGVRLEEEVLYIGDWSDWKPSTASGS